MIRGRDNPPTLDPAYASRTFDGHLTCLIHGGLVRSDPKGTVIPELARSWRIEDRGATYVFELIPSLRFPSGRTLEASDILESWSRVCRPETGSPISWIFEDIQGFDAVIEGKEPLLSGVEVLSPTEVRVTLEKFSSTFLARMTMPAARIVDYQEVQKRGDRYGRDPRALGAWELVEWEDDSHLLFRPNPLYPTPNDRLAGIRFELVSRDFSASARFETGKLHLINPLPPSQSSYWKRFSEWNESIQSSPQLNLYYLGFGCHRPPFDSPRVRKAVAQALDIEGLRKTLYGAKAVPAKGPIPPGLIGNESNQPGEEKREESDPEILRGLEFEMWYPDIDPMASLVMEGFQADLLEQGARCRLRRVDQTAYTSWRREGRFDLFLGNWWADFPDPDNFITPLFTSTSDSNMTRFKNEAVDLLADKARGEMDSSERTRIYREIGSALRAETPMIFLWHLNEEILIQPWVTGFEPSRLFQGNLYLNLGIAGAK